MNKMKRIKGIKLKEGDKVACISLSWGGAQAFPNKYLEVKQKIKDFLGLEVIETPNALKSPIFLSKHPKKRLDDLIWAFKNPEIKAIFTIIGGDDSIRLLNYLNESHFNLIQKNPKIFIGFSDSTTINFLCLKAGLISFYGPSVMFGIADAQNSDDFTLKNLKNLLFYDRPAGILKNSSLGWSVDRIDWSKNNNLMTKNMNKPLSIRCIHGSGIKQGMIVGGCMEVLEMLKGTSLWPSISFWKNKILLIELSEMNPSPEQFLLWLRNYAVTGILNQINGVIFGVPGIGVPFDDVNYSIKIKNYISSFKKYELMLLKVINEIKRKDLIVLTQVNFGHSVPMLTFPVGGLCELNANEKSISIIESVVEGDIND